MRQVIPIPADRAAEFDLTVDVAIRPRTSFDDSRAWTRLRIPLNKVLLLRDRVGLMESVAKSVNALLEQGVVIPDKEVP